MSALYRIRIVCLPTRALLVTISLGAPVVISMIQK